MSAGTDADVEWIEIAPIERIPPGHAARLELGGKGVAIFNCGGRFFACDDLCSHAEASLSEGELDVDRCRIECPLHGSEFDLRSGAPLTFPAVEPVLVHDTRVVSGILFVALTEDPDA